MKHLSILIAAGLLAVFAAGSAAWAETYTMTAPIEGYEHRFYVDSDYPVTGVSIVREEAHTATREEMDQVPYVKSRPEAVMFSGVGWYRGHQVVQICYFQLRFDREDRTTYYTDEVEFEFTFAAEPIQLATVKRYDSETARTLRNLVRNPDDVDQAIAAAPPGDPVAGIGDSVPCLIITDEAMRGVFEDYAEWKTRSGTYTEVVTVDSIDLWYPEATRVDRVRSCIRENYNDRYTEFVLLGGDIDIVPPLAIQPRAVDTLITDQYYACLDNGDWNQDGDAYVADPETFGDTVDFYPEVTVGRIPCGDSAEAAAVVNKLICYETDTTHIGYQTEALITSSLLYWDSLGPTLNAHLGAYLPESFTCDYFYESTPATVFASMNAGKSILVNNSHSQYEGNFLITYSPRMPLYYFDMDTLSNTGEYGVFFNYTCYNNMLDSALALSRHYMLNPNGGGIGYVGSVDVEQSLTLEDFHLHIFEFLFDSCETRPAVALANAKMGLRFFPDFYSVSEGYAYFANMYLGDPQTRVWTDAPQILTIECPDSLGSGADDAEIRVTSGGQGVAGVLLCLCCLPEVYMVDWTDENGWATFELPSISEAATATIVATKRNCFAAQASMEIAETCCGRYGFPTGYTGNTNCGVDGRINLADVSILINHVYITKDPLCCRANGNVNGDIDGKINLADIARLIDRVYLSKGPTAPCM